MTAKLQYISSESAERTQLENILDALQAGASWIQLRVKGESEEEIERIARKAKTYCEAYKATFILNDHVAIAKRVQADGVHLGQNDMPTPEARQILGEHAIIGGTANTWEHIQLYAKEKAVDYIGLGPFKFTKTKKNLSPILGLDGYRKIVEQCEAEHITIPIIAIGGIELEDIDSILQTGVHGIAVSGLIANATDKKAILQAIHQRLL